MSELQLALFKYNDGKIRTIIIDEEIWFIAVDISTALGYTNGRKAVSDHCFEDDVTNRYPIKDSLGRTQHPTLINESGLYALIFSSKLEIAKDFKRWVTSEILPNIRKTGSYGTTQTVLSPMMQRFALNAQKNSVLGYWSMLNKITELFALPLELAGLTLPESVVPDISTGKLFCDYLRLQGIDPDKVVKKYTHTYPDGREIPNVNQYPDTYYPMFTDWLKNVWIKEKSAKYLLDRMNKIGMAVLPHLLKAFPNQIDAVPQKYLVGYHEETATYK